MPAPNPLLLVDLGCLDYRETLALQHRCVEERLAGTRGDTLLLVEHPEVITLGRRRDARNNVLLPGAVPVVEVERGGDVTWHGPGQLVGYPIVLLGEGERDVHLVLRHLEDAMIALLAELGLEGLRRPGFTGVWARDAAGELKKLVSLGVAVRGWVTFHGFALNVDCDLSAFAKINPCGLESGVMGSLASLGVSPPPHEVLARRAALCVAAAFGRALAADPDDPIAPVVPIGARLAEPPIG